MKREITPKSNQLLYGTKNVSPFAKIEIIQPLICHLLDLLISLQIHTAGYGVL